MRQFIHCGKVVDCGEAEGQAATIVVEGGKILDVLPGYVEPSEGQALVNWKDYVVIPGMFSCHEHITLDSVGKKLPENEVGPVFGMRAVVSCQEFLRQGVTTVRDAGAKGALNIIIKKALQEGLFDGPDLFVAGHRLSRTGFTKWWACREVDGPDNIRQAVRDEHKNGADFIKLMVSGVVSGGGSPYDPQYSMDEIRTAVEEAHELGLKIAVHAYGGVGTSRAISAGVDSVEHGASLTDEDIRTMAKNGATYVMTYDAINHTASSSTAPSHLKSKAQAMIDAYAVTLPKIRKEGIVVGVGGDSHGFNPAAETSALVASGFTHKEALAALTVNGATICDMSDKGLIKRGFVADLVALEGNPLEDVNAYGKVRGVLKAGKAQR